MTLDCRTRVHRDDLVWLCGVEIAIAGMEDAQVSTYDLRSAARLLNTRR